MRKPHGTGLIVIRRVSPGSELAWHDLQQKLDMGIRLEDEGRETKATAWVVGPGLALVRRGGALAADEGRRPAARPLRHCFGPLRCSTFAITSPRSRPSSSRSRWASCSASRSPGSSRRADNRFAHDRIDQLSEQLQQANARADIIERRSHAAEELLEVSYPALMEDRLDGKNIGVLFLGPVDGTSARRSSARSRTRARAAPCGSSRSTPRRRGRARRCAERRPDARPVRRGRRRLRRASATRSGRSSSRAKGTPTWSALSSKLVEERSGASTPPLDGVVVVRSWTPPEDPTAEQEAQAHATETLVDGLLGGLQESRCPGRRRGDDDRGRLGDRPLPDAGRLERRRRRDLAGRVALALLLAGGDPGPLRRQGLGDRRGRSAGRLRAGPEWLSLDRPHCGPQ